MTKWIAIPAAALLLAAAWARPELELPAARRSIPAAVDVPPVAAPREASSRGGLLEALAGLALPTTPSEPALIGEIIRFHNGAGPKAQDEELALLGDTEALKAELRRAFNLGRYSRAERLGKRILEVAPQDVMARDMQTRIPEARRERVGLFTQIRPSSRLDAETLEDLTAEEWREIADSILHDRRVSLDVQQASVEWVLLELRLASGLPLILEASTVDRVRPDPHLTLRFEDVPLRQALRFVLDQMDPWLDLLVTDEKVVLIRSARDPDRY